LLDEGILDDVDTGKLSPDAFFNVLNNYSLELISPDRLVEAWNAMLVGIPPEHITLLRELALEYKLLALSNTNAIHIDWIEKHVAAEYEMSFRDLFSKGYFSFEMGIRKPDPRVFQAILAEQNLLPAETLLIDDTPENLESAARLGLVTELIHEGNPLLDLFS
jgi:putative hydrolase of the HAD superfamily